MQDYSLSFLFSPWLVLLGATILLIYTLWMYNRQKGEISSGKRKALILLRSLSFALLLLVVSSPMVTMLKTISEEPVVSIYVDNSASIMLDSEASESETMKTEQVAYVIDQIDNLGLESSSQFHFADTIYEMPKDAMVPDGTGDYTNLENVIYEIGQDYRSDNTRAAIIVSDGNINHGKNPIYLANKSRVPLYVVGVGDTTVVRDIAVTNFTVDRQSPLNSIVRIGAEIKWSDLENSTKKVTVLKDSTTIYTKQLEINKKSGSISIDITDLADKVGTFTYSITVDSLSTESNTLNNVRKAVNTVKAIDKQLSLFAGAPSSDVSFIFNTLDKLPNTAVSKFIQKKGSQYYVNPTVENLAETDALVLVNFPIKSTSTESLERIAGFLASGTPMLFIAGPNTDWRKVDIIQSFLPFTIVQSNTREYSVQLDPSKNSTAQTIFLTNQNTVSADEWKALPPLFRTETFVKLKPSATSLASSVVNGRGMNDPLISTFEISKSKVVASLGYGFYEWKLNGYARDVANRIESEDLFTRFLTNTIGFLSVKNKSSRFQLTTDRRTYAKSDIITIKGQVYDEAMRPLSGADIDVVLKGADSLQREIKLVQSGYGLYTAEIEGLTAGSYQLTGAASKNEVAIGQDFSGFIVSDIDIEMTELSMNKQLLTELALSSGGKFYTYSEIESLKEDIINSESFKSRSRDQTTDVRLWDFYWILILIVILFSTEWALRKKWGLL